MVAVVVAIGAVEQLEGDAREVLGGRHAVEHDGLVARDAGQEVEHYPVAARDEEGVVPGVDDVTLGDRLDLREVHHHSVGGVALALDNVAGQGNFDGVAVSVQVTALAGMVGDAVTGIEFEAAGDEHARGGEADCGGARILLHAPLRPADVAVAPGGSGVTRAEAAPPVPLSFERHDRDSAGLRYVYPVLSRRAGGISVGVNLNTNNACNWACVYCQVPELRRGGPPPVDLAVLRSELATLLGRIQRGDFAAAQATEGSPRIADLAFSGNGEPTSAAEFADAVGVAADCLRAERLLHRLPLRLITNGSLVARPAVAEGLRRLADAGGEVWFKLDRATVAGTLAINGVRRAPARALADLLRCAALVPTWVQTCWFAGENGVPDAAETAAYLDLLRRAGGAVRGVYLYGLARPSMQPGGEKLRRLDGAELELLAQRIRDETALAVSVSP